MVHSLPSMKFPAMQKRYTASVIGLGRIAFSLGFDKLREQPASHTMALLANRRIKIVSGCDTDMQKCYKWQEYVERKQHSAVDIYKSAREMFDIQKEKVSDIVVVAVNEDAHLDMALDAIEARPRLVILEKPVALNSKEGKRIREASLLYSVPVMINHERRFARDYRFAREYIAGGHIGDVQSVTAELDSSLRVYSPSEDGTGAYSLIHDGTHLVDITRYLLGNAMLVKPMLVNLTHCTDDSNVIRNIAVHFEAQAEDTQRLEAGESANASSVGKVDEANGALKGSKVIACPDVLIKMSGRSKFFHFAVEVLGTEGRVRVGNGFAQFERRAKSKLYTGFYSLTEDMSVRHIVHGLKKTCCFSNMVKNAVDFLDGTAGIESTLQDGIDDLMILEEMRAFCTAKDTLKGDSTES